MAKKKSHKIDISKPKVRRAWTRSPAEQTVNNKRVKRSAGRKLSEDALDEYNESDK